MEVFFVKYSGNQPVAIRTHQFVGTTGQWIQTLFNVADMIGAYRLGSLLAETPRELLTLHAVIDGVEGPALEPDLLLSDLTAGRTAKSALVIKSHNPLVIKAQNYMEVDETGVPAFEGAGAEKVKLSTDADVVDFRKKVWEENKEGLLKDDIANPAKVLEADAPANRLGEAKKTSPSGSIQSVASGSMDVDVRWKDEEPTVYSLRDWKLYFVNRSDAVEQLQTIHRSKFIRATTGGGVEWIIPIADNVLGLGKSEFGRHYIRKSRESWPDETRRDAFERTLCDCHTVPIEFHRGALLEDPFEAVMIRFLCDALEDLFVVQPAIISNPPKTVNAFLKSLTKVA
ncbi:hypothetical protein HDU84_009307, partial [Entophlyctis sp. JEL0112]